MPGEDPTAMWEANKMSFYKAKSLMKKGCKEGSSCEEIYSAFGLYSAQWAEEGAQLLNLLKEKALLSVLNHFPSVEKQRLKMTLVSLISIFIRLHKTKSDHLIKVVKACHEVWDLVSFADECDIDLQADAINIIDDLNKDNDQVSMAANREFYKLQMEYDKLSSDQCEDCVLDDEEVQRFLKNLSRKCQRMLVDENLVEGFSTSPGDLNDSKDWTKIAPSYTLFKICELMLEKDSEDLVKWTEESLRNVIALCMSRLPHMLVKKCWKWAQEFEEDKLWEAIQLAGKCRGLREEWGREPKATVNSTQHKTLYQRFKMCILCRPAEESASRGEQALSNAEQCTIEVK
ncbi:hypothetical protein SUGI_0328510 [Cryptomeria japonica]|nr:hypothetical protein SUGI_0328510 [Cryptomeria japonica]